MDTINYSYLLTQLYKEIKSKKWNDAYNTYQLILEAVFINEEVPTLFKELLDKNALKAFKDIKLVTYKRGNVVFREGDKPDSMYLIVKGSVSITQKSLKTKVPVLPMPPVLVNYVLTTLLSCKPKQIASLSTGNFFGEMGIISSKPRTASVIAEQDLDVVRITLDDVRRAVKVKPHLYSLLREYYTSRLDAMVDSLKDINNNVSTCMVDTVLESIMKQQKSYTVDNALFCKISEAPSSHKDITLSAYSDVSAKVSEINTRLENIITLYKSGKKRQAITEYVRVIPLLMKDITSDFLFHQFYLASTVFMNILELIKMVDRFYEVQNFIPVKIPVQPLIDKIQKSINIPVPFLSEGEEYNFTELLKEELTSVPVENFNSGDVIINYGDSGDSLYLVKKGKVKVFSMLVNQDVQSEGDTLKAGEFFGEFCYLTKKNWVITVIAKGKVSVYTLERTLVDTLIIKYPEILDYMKKKNLKQINALLKETNDLKDFYKEELTVS